MKSTCSPSQIQTAAAKWSAHEFYQSAVVLGLDIGMEGIGVYLRHGREEVYARTWLFDVPKAKALAGRRSKRAWRRSRKNRKTRLHRLKLLFAHHGLPWVSEDAMSRTDPFLLRRRAITGMLASGEALSVCIRQIVAHRGYDYSWGEEGDFPWGDAIDPKAAMDWLADSFIEPGITEDLNTLAEGMGWTEDEVTLFMSAVKERAAWSLTNGIPAMLENYARGTHPNLRPRGRGHNFPRTILWAHLKEICDRHAHLVSDYSEFIATLGLRPRTPAENRKSIFFFNRKTRTQMRQHWEKKVSDCPFAPFLDLPAVPKCGTNADPDVRKWKALEFGVTRRVECVMPKTSARGDRPPVFLHTLSGNAVKALVAFVDTHAAAVTHGSEAPPWAEARKIIDDDVDAAHPGARVVPSTKSEWNQSFMTQAKDIATPTLANRRKRAGLSPSSAARLLSIATEGGSDFNSEGVVQRLRDMGFYRWRGKTVLDHGVYPQVEFLLGRRLKRPKEVVLEDGQRIRKTLSETCRGKLRRLFESLASEGKLAGKTAPDYCVIEVVRDIPRNALQKKEVAREQLQRRKDREGLFDAHMRDDTGVRSRRTRITLHAQQKGKCPFTGDPLPADPLSQDLEIEHLWPESRGGLATDENIVLTFRKVNSLKDNRTPREAAEAVPGWSWAGMMAATRDMRWSEAKRAIFEFRPSAESTFPDFGNLTRTSQISRQLRAAVAEWMDVDGDPDEAARRIGTPSGWLAAQARRGWLTLDGKMYRKIRSNLVHHLVDAAVLTQIPPREGMNHLSCGGIFFSVDPGLGIGGRPWVRALPGLGPDVSPWLVDVPETCPVEKHRSSSRGRSIGDDTFWRREGDKLYQRQPLTLDSKNLHNPEAIIATLRLMHIPVTKIPPRRVIQDWLDANDPERPLRLVDGTPIKNIWKSGDKGKGNFTSPLGWTGRRSTGGKLWAIRRLSVVFDRAELWIGWNPRKKAWMFQKRLVPDPNTLTHLKRMGFRWKGIAPAEFQSKPDLPETFLPLKEIIEGPPLFPFSHKVAKLRRGDVFLVPLDRAGAIHEGEVGAFWHCWCEVTAIKANGQLEFKPSMFRDKADTPLADNAAGSLVWAPSKPAVLARIAGLPDATQTAMGRGLREPAGHDTPSHPPRRKPRHPSGKGQADLGI